MQSAGLLERKGLRNHCAARGPQMKFKLNMKLHMKSGRFWKDFAVACFWGALAGCSPYLVFSVPFGILFAITGLIEGEWDRLLGVILMLLPLIVAYPVTFAALLFLGVPLYVLLSRLGPVTPFPFGALGALCGATVFAIFIGEWNWDILGLGAGMGAVSGAITGYLWADAMARQTTDQLS
jgi:hypothetical protein